MGQINVIIDDSLHKKVKIKAVREDTTIKNFMIEKFEEWVK